MLCKVNAFHSSGNSEVSQNTAIYECISSSSSVVKYTCCKKWPSSLSLTCFKDAHGHFAMGGASYNPLKVALFVVFGM